LVLIFLFSSYWSWLAKRELRAYQIYVLRAVARFSTSFEATVFSPSDACGLYIEE